MTAKSLNLPVNIGFQTTPRNNDGFCNIHASVADKSWPSISKPFAQSEITIASHNAMPAIGLLQVANRNAAPVNFISLFRTCQR
jgi:hypothetical protein